LMLCLCYRDQIALAFPTWQTLHRFQMSGAISLVLEISIKCVVEIRHFFRFMTQVF
jgi:hypothetical protein